MKKRINASEFAEADTTCAGGPAPAAKSVTKMKRTNKVDVTNVKMGEEFVNEKSKGDEYEYDYEGDMAMSQLKSIMMNAKQLHDMLEPNTNLPEWVQSKITLAKDYIETARDYLQTQMKESIEEGKALSFQQRLVRARQMRRIEPKVYRGQIRYQDRVPSQARLEKRAERMARNVIKMRISHTPYDQMSIPEKIMIDKILEKKQKAIKKLAQRLLPKVRKISMQRISGAGTLPSQKMPRLREETDAIPYLSESVETIYALASGEETKAVKALKEKAEKAGVPFESIVEVYSEAIQEYTPRKISSEQYAFNAVNSFVSNKINEDFKQMSINQMFSEMFIGPPTDPINLAALRKRAKKEK